jgi:hypothetical protein
MYPESHGTIKQERLAEACMSVHLERCSNALCRRLYEVEHFSPCFGGRGMRVGVIECPHCATTVSAKPSLVYVARAVPMLWERWNEDDDLEPLNYQPSATGVPPSTVAL